MQLLCFRAPLFFHHTRAFSSMAPTSSTSSSAAVAVSRVVTTKASLRGVVFDMDGTLTVPVIDFPAMYRAVLGEEAYVKIKSENPSGIDILHHIETWSPDKQKRAYEIIADFEKQGSDRLQIMPGYRLNFSPNCSHKIDTYLPSNYPDSCWYVCENVVYSIPNHGGKYLGTALIKSVR
ncbi:hypothetical protein ABFS83_14G030900 [Erythranthe nasuta]